MRLYIVFASFTWWAIASFAQTSPTPDINAIKANLSPSAQIFPSGSTGFNEATARWSEKDAPNPKWIVVPATEQDVAATVKYANSVNMPFLTISGRHGAMATLGDMESGIGIWLKTLDKVQISKDGKSAKIGGGSLSKNVIDTLWNAGKQTVTGTCECTGYISPGLGGGHGWLQGRYGLIADQWLSANIVLADGTFKTIDSKSDLWWAINGAGHNFGIVTSVTSKIYDIKDKDWAHETFIFKGDKIEELFKRINKYHVRNGSQPVELINWSYVMNIPQIDPSKPVILVYVLEEGAASVNPEYTKPLHDLGPVDVQPGKGTYLDLATWAGIDMNGPPCRKNGMANLRYPIDVDSYDGASIKQAYDVFASATKQGGPFNNSLFLFEAYSTQGVKAIPSDSTAYAFRADNLLIAPLITYQAGNSENDQKANALGEQLRNIIHNATGRSEIHAYVNYAYPGDTAKEWYGYEKWRQDKLLGLKNKYDAKRRFSFFGPIA